MSIKREYMLKKFLKDNSNFNVQSYYALNLKKNDNEFIFTMVHHYSYDFYMGIGKSELDAVKNIKCVINAYEKSYSDLKIKLDNYIDVDLDYKPESITNIRIHYIWLDEPTKSVKTFCDEEDAYAYIKNDSKIFKVEQKINKSWVDVTDKFRK